jgi:hypothetical protein
MPEPFIERLSLFTPDGSRLDRDALLFAAGRASGRRHRAWPAVAGLLAAAQLLTLALLWPRSIPSEEKMAANAPLPEIIVTSAPATPPDAAALWSLSRDLFQSPDGDLAPPAPIDSSIVPDRPFYAGQLPAVID